MDYEGMILARDERNYESGTMTDEITIHELNISTGRYDKSKTLCGEAARLYMEEHGIW